MNDHVFSYPEEVVRANNKAHAELRERAEKAEAMLEKAKGIMSNMAQAGSDTELELARHRQIVHEVTLLIDMIAAMPERPGAVRVRELRARASRVRVFLSRVLR